MSRTRKKKVLFRRISVFITYILLPSILYVDTVRWNDKNLEANQNSVFSFKFGVAIFRSIVGEWTLSKKCAV